MAAKPFAFVLMPFEAAFSDIYKFGIQAVAHECGVLAQRIDEQTYSETILDRIYRQIESADFIIADMTGRNPNVFYEVGYAHAKDKLCTLLTQSADDIPFDLRHHRHVIYEGSIQSLKSKMIPEIEWLKEESTKQKAQPFSIDLRSSDGELVKDEYSDESVINLVFDIKNKTKKRSPEIDAIYIYTKKDWKLEQDSQACAHIPMDDNPNSRRHFMKPPVPRLSPDAWAQFTVVARKDVWSKWSGKERKTKYVHGGTIRVEISTADGVFTGTFNPSIESKRFLFDSACYTLMGNILSSGALRRFHQFKRPIGLRTAMPCPMTVNRR